MAAWYSKLKAGRSPLLTPFWSWRSAHCMVGPFLIWNLAAWDQEQGLSFHFLSGRQRKEAECAVGSLDSGPLWGWGGGVPLPTEEAENEAVG